MFSDHAGQGKIQRAPAAIREELNLRMVNGALGPQLLPWLNGLADIQRICREHFAGEEVSAKNLSDYRTGAYQKWLKRREGMAKQRELNDYALNLVRESGLHLGDAAAALAAGRLLEAIEKLGDEECPADEMVSAINDLRKGDHKARELNLKDKTHEHLVREFELREENTAWAVAAKIKKALESREFQSIADSDADDESKMQDFVRIAFGDDLLSRMKARRKEAP